VDGNPDNNTAFVDILKRLKVETVVVTTTQDVLQALRVSPFDVLITNVWRPNDPVQGEISLTTCPVHYFDFPEDSFQRQNPKESVRTRFNNDIDSFNEFANKHAAAGYGLAEIVVSSSEGVSTTPEIVFFSGIHARFARPKCGYRITNRPDVLLNDVVSIVEQRHVNSLSTRASKKN
jgi:hypothetical protein